MNELIFDISNYIKYEFEEGIESITLCFMKEIEEVIIPFKCNTINIHDYPNISSILVYGNNTNSVIITNFQRIILITFPKKHSTLSIDSTCVVISI